MTSITGTSQKKNASIQKRRIGALKDERHKLLEAHYADAVPLELLKTEQDRIGTELEHGGCPKSC